METSKPRHRRWWWLLAVPALAGLAVSLTLWGPSTPQIEILKGLTPIREEGVWTYYSVPMSWEKAEEMCVVQFPDAEEGAIQVVTSFTVAGGKGPTPTSIPQFGWSSEYLTMVDRDWVVEIDTPSKPKTKDRCMVRVRRQAPSWLRWIQKRLGHDPAPL